MNKAATLYEAVYYGADLEFKYNGYFYFVNSGRASDGNHMITVMKSTGSFYEDNDAKDAEEIYSSTDSDFNKNTENFFNALIFDGRCLYEIIDEIEDISY